MSEICSSRTPLAKVLVSGLCLVALIAWFLWVGYVSVGVWVAIVVTVPLAPTVAMAIRPSRGNRWLVAMMLFGLVFVMPYCVLSDDDMIQGYGMWGVGIVGCVVSWILLLRRYLLDWRVGRVAGEGR